MVGGFNHMEISSVASELASSASVSGSINVALLSAIDNLSAVQGAQIASAIELSSGIDTYA
jgi:hypothetical protein